MGFIIFPYRQTSVHRFFWICRYITAGDLLYCYVLQEKKSEVKYNIL